MKPLLRNDILGLPTFAPSIDIYDLGDALSLRADLPGVRQDDVDVVVDDRILSIIARSSLKSDPKFVPIHEEFRASHFFRSFILTDEVRADGIEAHLENGVLTIRLPKRAA